MILYLRRLAGLTNLLLKRASFQRASMGPVGARASSCIGKSLSILRSSNGEPERPFGSLHEAEQHRQRQEHVARGHQERQTTRNELEALVVARVVEANRLQHAESPVIE